MNLFPEKKDYPVKISEFKIYFSDDFSFSRKKISDAKIRTSFEIASIEIAKCLIGSKIYKYAFMELAAYYLFNKYGNGLDDSGFSGSIGVVQNMSNGDFHKSYVLPEKFLKSPMWAFLATNKYGLNYLQMVYPCTMGNIGIARGASTYR